MGHVEAKATPCAVSSAALCAAKQVHPFAFKAYFEENYKAMEDFETLDDGSSRF